MVKIKELPILLIIQWAMSGIRDLVKKGNDGRNSQEQVLDQVYHDSIFYHSTGPQLHA
jgi:hypothetical protein